MGETYLAAAMIAAGLVAAFWRPTVSSPLSRNREGIFERALRRVEEGRLGRYVEDVVGGAGEITGGRYLLLLLVSSLTALLLLFPAFGVVAPVGAAIVGLLAGQVYLMRAARRRRQRLDDQTLRLSAVLAAAGEIYREITPNALKEIGPPLEEDLGAVLRAIQTGLDPDRALAALQQETRSKRLRRLAGLLRLVESGHLGGKEQQVLFRRFYAGEIRREDRIREVRILTAQARGTLWIIVGLLPLLLLFKMMFRGREMAAYISSGIGRVILGVALLLVIGMVGVALRWTKVSEE